MDFDKIDIINFLKASMFDRFQTVSPFDFEDFIAHLFKTGGFEVQQTDYTGDFGADLILKKDGESTVVQVKRYLKTSPVGAQDINQVIGSKSYYKCDHALMITTSKYTKAAEKLSQTADVELWDWDDLADEISNVWLDEKDYFEYFSDSISELEDFDSKLILHAGELLQAENDKYKVLIFEIENTSSENVHCLFEMPIILTNSKQQIRASQWVDDYFNNGIIYAGMRVQCQCLILSDIIQNLQAGDRLILRIFMKKHNAYFNLDEPLIPAKGSCLASTFSMAVCGIYVLVELL